MKQSTVLFILIACFYGSLHSQEKFDLSELLNGEGLNNVVTQFDYLKRSERIVEGDTLRGYLLDHSKYIFLGNPVGEIEIHETNGLVHLISFKIEENELDASQLFDSIDGMKGNDQIIEGSASGSKTGTTAVTIEEIEKADRIERNKRKAAIHNFITNNSPITSNAIDYLNERFGEIILNPSCQFDCRDTWTSKYAEIAIEKNNYYQEDGESSKVIIDQTLGIILSLKK